MDPSSASPPPSSQTAPSSHSIEFEPQLLQSPTASFNAANRNPHRRPFWTRPIPLRLSKAGPPSSAGRSSVGSLTTDTTQAKQSPLSHDPTDPRYTKWLHERESSVHSSVHSGGFFGHHDEGDADEAALMYARHLREEQQRMERKERVKDVMKKVTSDVGNVSIRREKNAKQSRLFIDPFSLLRMGWDVFMLALLVYVATVLIYVCCFLGTLPWTSGFLWTDLFVCASFGVDVVLNFFTGYVRPDKVLEVRPWPIARYYLTHWFIIDVVSAIPWQFISTAMTKPGDVSLYEVPTFLRLIKLLKVSELIHRFEALDWVSRLEVKLRVNTVITKILSLVIMAVFLAHWIACFFYFAAKVQPSLESTWIQIAMDLGFTSNFQLYILALYYAVYTIVSIGYGEFYGVSIGEKIYMICAMLMGVSMWTLVLSNLTNLIKEYSSDTIHYRVLLDALPELSRGRNVPFELEYKMRRYLLYLIKSHSFTREAEILRAMSPELRADAMLFVLGPSIRTFHFAKSFDDSMLTEICSHVKVLTMAPDEHVYHAMDEFEYVYVIIAGTVELQDSIGTSLKTLRHGEGFGEEGLLSGNRRTLNAVCVDYCDVYAVPRVAILQSLERKPKILSQLRKAEFLYLWRRAMPIAIAKARLLKISRILLGSANHYLNTKNPTGAKDIAQQIREGQLRRKKKIWRDLIRQLATAEKALDDYEAVLNS